MRRSIGGRLGMALLVACLIMSYFPPAPVEAARKRVLNFAAKEPETLDPHTSVLGQVQASVRFLYRGLTRFAIKDGKVTTAEVEPDLAESWTTSDDGTMWTFKLRKGVQFHKGFGEMTAEDVKFSFERQIKRTKGMLFTQNLDVIKEITVVDPYTVQITLKAYDPVFLLRMVGYQHGYILSKKAAEQFGEQFGWNPVGTGPFYFDKHLPREKVILKAHDKYYFGRPQIDEVHWFDVPEDATKLIGLEKGTFDILYPEAVTADVQTQVEKMGAVLDKRGPGG
ncbi:MAG TPA: ABC transporter substrate-binding protein, partial [Candidatus Tectomicrobia bacterium]